MVSCQSFVNMLAMVKNQTELVSFEGLPAESLGPHVQYIYAPEWLVNDEVTAAADRNLHAIGAEAVLLSRMTYEENVDGITLPSG